jgi:hypothetical protein
MAPPTPLIRRRGGRRGIFARDPNSESARDCQADAEAEDKKAGQYLQAAQDRFQLNCEFVSPAQKEICKQRLLARVKETCTDHWSRVRMLVPCVVPSCLSVAVMVEFYDSVCAEMKWAKDAAMVADLAKVGRCDCSSSLCSTRIILDRRRQVASEKMAEFEKKISEAELQVAFPFCTTAPRSPRTVKLSSCGGNCWFRRARMSCAKPISPRPSSCITQAPSEPRTPYVPTIPNIPITHKPPLRACQIPRLLIIGFGRCGARAAKPALDHCADRCWR